MRRALFLILLLHATHANAQSGIAGDVNGDGAVNILAFGDSITYGVGDDIPPGRFVDEVALGAPKGYPERVERLAQVPVANRGSPGELITVDGSQRIADAVASTNADIAIIFDGTNDAGLQVSSADYRRALQRSVNIVRALGAVPALGTLLTPCCNRDGRGPFIDEYNRVVNDVAAINSIELIDFARAFRTTCQNSDECELYNIPEGLHPNSRGHDVLGQVVLAKLFGIDIFAVEGAAELESALGLEPGSVIVRPGA